MNVFDFVLSNWPILISFVSFIIWLVRLEGLVKVLEREIHLIERRQSGAVEQIAETLKHIMKKQEETADKLQNLQLDVAKIVAFEEGRRSVIEAEIKKTRKDKNVK